MSKGNVTLGDVAAAAGVSVGTASRALGAVGRVSEATRERVRAAAERLDFRPDALARSFVTGRSATVGVLAEHAVGLHSMPVLVGASERLGERGIATLMRDAHATRSELAEHLKTLRARRVDALLVVGDTPDITEIAESLDFPSPLVFANIEPSAGQRCVVTADERQAGELAAAHLLGLGRRRIAHITASAALPAVALRAAGLVDALSARGVELVTGGSLHGSYEREWGYEATQRLLTAREGFDAVVAGNDGVAGGVLAALAEAGRRVPDDVAVIGHDNLERHTARGIQSLTSIDPSRVDIGRAAADAVLAAIAGEETAPVIRVPVALAVGRSTTGPTLSPFRDIDR
ncbi:LacI family DNA-binding transcriptional regulator [Microbacterium sp.]|uniref:LacI family DNA-binding transcriptional regulator n=1 Tax=Microbacterium sp. TaxID=51671 RepID=UPI00333E474F